MLYVIPKYIYVVYDYVIYFNTCFIFRHRHIHIGGQFVGIFIYTNVFLNINVVNNSVLLQNIGGQEFAQNGSNYLFDKSFTVHISRVL